MESSIGSVWSEAILTFADQAHILWNKFISIDIESEEKETLFRESARELFRNNPNLVNVRVENLSAEEVHTLRMHPDGNSVVKEDPIQGITSPFPDYSGHFRFSLNLERK